MKIKNFIDILIYLFLILGLIFIIFNKKIPLIYLVLLIFFLLKIIFNYRHCTISYLECLIRGVKRQQGYLNYFLDNIIDKRYDNDIILLYLIAFYILFYQFIINNTFEKLRQ